MHYTAYHRAEVLTSGPDLDEVLWRSWPVAATRRSPEDAVIYHGGLVVAVVMSTGQYIRFEAMPTPITWRVSA